MYHILAFITILIWGVTFISTKILLEQGLTPSDIFILRFILGYIGMALYSHKKWFCDNWRDEAIMVMAGITGGSLYFVGENTALLYTQAGNVSLIICLAPLLTALFSQIKKTDETTSVRLWIGSVIALAGVAFVVNDDSGSHANPLLGNTLALLSAACWACYQLLIKPISNQYDVSMLTRKVFGYGLITMVPYWIYTAPASGISHILPLLERPVVLGNIIFLGLMASLMGYLLWNLVVQHLGAVVSSNYIYLDPLITCIFAYFILDEPLTTAMLLGGIGILAGIYIAVGIPKPKRAPK